MVGSVLGLGAVARYGLRFMEREPRDPAFVCLLPVTLALLAAACSGGELSYLDRRADFSSDLSQADAAAAANREALSSAGVLRGEPPSLPAWDIEWGSWHETVYPSGDWQLEAYTFVPNDTVGVKRPGFVFLHNGAYPHTYLPQEVLDDTKAIVEAGFVVVVPTFRGEGGNSGTHEFWLGEVDDAASAVRWLVEQPYVDADHTYAVGWSYGGTVATLLSLLPDVPVRHSASFGGLVTREWFNLWPKPFDTGNPVEVEMRMLIGNIRWMQRRHYAYTGSADLESVQALEAVRREVGGEPALLEVITIPGGHSQPAALTAIEFYLRRVQEEMDRSR